MTGNRVCVLGAGPVGLVATKNLTEQGLEVTTFEKGDHIGGIWRPNNYHLSVLPRTSKNTSKQCVKAATHPLAHEVEDYLNAYAIHFQIFQHIQLSTQVIKIDRDEANGQWIVSTKSTKAGSDGLIECRAFDRVVVASGMLNIANMPKIKGSDKFEGEIVHSRYFKDPSKYEGKRVIVVGVGASGADTQSFLKTSNAKKIYLSHRKQMLLLPRMVDGKAFDHSMTRRAGSILRTLLSWWPNATMKLMMKPLTMARKKAFPYLDSHSSFNAPRLVDGIPYRVPVFSEDLAANINSGIVEAVPGITEVSGPRSVTLTDGTVVDDIDAIIVCAGYSFDFSIVAGAGNPLDPEFAPDGYAAYKSGRFYDPESPFPRLYQGFISEQYPDSLAFLGHLLVMKPPFVMYDLATMALASIWSGAYAPGLPSIVEMKKDIDAQYDFIVRMLENGPMHYSGIRIQNAAATYAWMNRVGGTGVDENVGNWGLAAWKFWWTDPEFYGLLMDGPDTPYIYRLFKTAYGRKPWAGAKEQILETNREIKKMGEIWKKENNNKKTV